MAGPLLSLERQQRPSHVTPSPGVGDEAFSVPGPHGNAGSVGASSFGAVFGNIYSSVGGRIYVTAAQDRQIAEQLHSKL